MGNEIGISGINPPEENMELDGTTPQQSSGDVATNEFIPRPPPPPRGGSGGSGGDGDGDDPYASVRLEDVGGLETQKQ